MSAKRVTLLYLVTQDEYDILVKNPHCIQFFCNKNILILDQLNTQTDIYEKDIKLTPDFLHGFLSQDQLVKYQYIFPYERDYAIQELDYEATMELIKLSKRITMDNFYQKRLFIRLKEVRQLNLEHKYMGTQYRCFSTNHLGQLKLFLSTLQFLLYYAPPNKEIHVVYPGSAEGHNIPFIMSLFPQCRWYLIDPKERGFDKRLYNHPKTAYIKKSLFNDKIVNELYDKLKNKYTLLISDIRLHEKMTMDSEDEITRDNRLQEEWVQKFHPTYAQLKFRLPRTGETFNYLDGEVYLQMYAPHATTETRLVVDGRGKLKYKDYNLDEYENNLYQFNRLLRPAYYQYDDLPSCMDHCHDCVATLHLLKEYKEMYPENWFSKKDINEMVDIMLRKIDDPRNIGSVRHKMCDQMAEEINNFYPTTKTDILSDINISDDTIQADIKSFF